MSRKLHLFGPKYSNFLCVHAMHYLSYQHLYAGVGYELKKWCYRRYKWAEFRSLNKYAPFEKDMVVKGVPFTYKRTAKTSSFFFKGK